MFGEWHSSGGVRWYGSGVGLTACTCKTSPDDARTTSAIGR